MYVWARLLLNCSRNTSYKFTNSPYSLRIVIDYKHGCEFHFSWKEVGLRKKLKSNWKVPNVRLRTASQVFQLWNSFSIGVRIRKKASSKSLLDQVERKQTDMKRKVADVLLYQKTLQRKHTGSNRISGAQHLVFMWWIEIPIEWKSRETKWWPTITARWLPSNKNRLPLPRFVSYLRESTAVAWLATQWSSRAQVQEKTARRCHITAY